ncbi:hypothetical protein DPMN_064244 [Dreissena polymorpha]|uniref:Uncharacterized protein n=1 Tax=Dreissena polymorpha TaxID=45954 RepID=A0A9D4HKZ7_DREPO|nr:hypothetical protein DPMN_064244 [Dreissena polymorpha]
MILQRKPLNKRVQTPGHPCRHCGLIVIDSNIHACTLLRECHILPDTNPYDTVTLLLSAANSLNDETTRRQQIKGENSKIMEAKAARHLPRILCGWGLFKVNVTRVASPEVDMTAGSPQIAPAYVYTLDLIWLHGVAMLIVTNLAHTDRMTDRQAKNNIPRSFDPGA